MINLPADVEGQLADAQMVQEKLARDLKGMLEMIRGGVAGEPLRPVEKAQAYLAISQAVHALFQLHTRTAGLDPSSQDAVQGEEQRLQQYAKKVNKVLAAQILADSKPSLALNVEAANRFITAAIPDLTPEQKVALQQATQDVKRKAEEQDKQHQGKGKAGGPAGKRHKQGSNSAKEAAVAFLQGLQTERTSQTVGVSMSVVDPSEGIEGQDTGTGV